MVYIILVALILFDLYGVYKHKKNKSNFIKLTLIPLILIILLFGANDLGYINYTTTVILFIPIALYYFIISGGIPFIKKK
ncbi:hypothetical protein [Clostridium intestinale]|uniref:Uncharacterized protein n=1 Tax=Clostridium intestinale DSM 6191 TaxID=1121320 RepID=A0A1M5SXD3_9CLOT|nr:hypothetical protein [Clostridium intestinale]SHH43115.1 hypothetical protein SAMN02745941_00045 [Clostridium intestinale DSM 6191]